MLRTAGSSTHPDADAATRLTRRAANAAAIALVAFAALFVVSSEIGSVRDQSPWSEDPFDIVVSVAILVGPALALVTFVRVQRWAGARRMPHDALRLVLRGALVALLLVAAAIGATLLATLTGQRSESWGPATPWLVVGAVGTGISVIVAAALLSAAARNVAQPESRPEPTDAPDALDDLVAFFERLSALAHVRASRLGRAIDTVPRTLRAWLDSPRWSPRRHPVAFPAVLALVFGISFSGWHAVTEGTAWTYGGLLVSVFYAGVAATIVLMSYALLGRYLRLVHTLS